MSYDEWHRWILYRRKFGVSLHRGVEHAAALVSRSVAGGRFEDYLPQRESAQPTEPIGPEQAMAQMGGRVVRR